MMVLIVIEKMTVMFSSIILIHSLLRTILCSQIILTTLLIWRVLFFGVRRLGVDAHVPKKCK